MKHMTAKVFNKMSHTLLLNRSGSFRGQTPFVPRNALHQLFVQGRFGNEVLLHGLH
jgi:hypothetical protein